MKNTTFLFLIFVLNSCSNQTPIELNNHAIECFQKGNFIEANNRLDKAIELDSEYLLAYQNKLIVLNSLGEKQQLIEIQGKLLKLDPNNPDNLVRMGIFYELENDTINSIKYFQSADSLFKIILDTLNQEKDPEFSITINKAQNLKLLGKEKEANELLTEIKREIEPDYLKELVDYYLTMTKKDILKNMRYQKPNAKQSLFLMLKNEGY